MTILEACVQGVIQGLTEFLPVSSSGHLALYQYFTGQGGESGALFSLVLHFGTLVAVVAAFWSTIRQLAVEFFRALGDLVRGRINWRRPNPNQKMIFLLIVSLLPLFLTLLLKDPLRAVAQDNDIIVEGICFLVTGVLLFLGDSCVQGRRRAPEMSYRGALTIGLVQAVAPLPGISRSGSTLSAGLLMGLDQKFAVTFSFIMGIPAVCAALLLDAKEITGGGLNLPPSVILAGLITSAVFGLLAIGMVRWLVSSRKLRWFAFYTFALGIVVLALGIYEMAAGHPVQSAVIAFLQ